MNMKSKIFSFISVSGIFAFVFALLGQNLGFSFGASADFKNNVVDDVIDFDGSKVEKITDKSPYISRTTTKQGDYVYLACQSDVSLDRGSVAAFRDWLTEDADKIDSVIKFYSYNGSKYEQYSFQDINSVSIVSSHSISAIGVYKSGDGINYEKIGTMSVNTYDSEKSIYTGTFPISNFEDENLKLVQESQSAFRAQIKRVVLGYTCDNDYVPPVKHEISSTPTENGSINLSTTKRKAGALTSFSVVPNTGYVVDTVMTDPVVELNVSGFSYSFIMPESDISISATFEEAPVVSYSVSAKASEHGSVNLTRTEYYEGESVAFTITANNGYEVSGASTDPELSVSGSDGSYNFIMPASDVEIIPAFKQITSLSLSGEYQTDFMVDDEFNYDGLVVTAHYDDSTSKVVSDFSVSSPDMSSAGTKTVTVTHRGVSTTYNINVSAPVTIDRIEVSGTYKTSYHIGQTVDHTGVVVTAVYSDGTRSDVTPHSSFTDPDMSYKGTKFVTARYLTYSTRYEITVADISSLVVNAPDSAKKFYVNDEFHHNGVEVTAVYGNGDEVDVSDLATFSIPDLSAVSKLIPVTVSYGGVSTNYYVSTKAKLLETLTLEIPEQPVFKKGNTFNHDTVKVKANYNDYSSEEINAVFSLDGQKLDTIGDNIEVTVTYTEQGIRGETLTATGVYTIKVEDAPQPSSDIYSILENLGTLDLISAENDQNEAIISFSKKQTGECTHNLNNPFVPKTATYSFDFIANDVGNHKYTLTVTNYTKTGSYTVGFENYRDFYVVLDETDSYVNEFNLVFLVIVGDSVSPRTFNYKA